MARVALLVLAAFYAAVPTAAQEALPETPPELRDFRLDPQRPEAQPQPETQSQVTPPPAVPTITEDQPAPEAQRQAEPQRRAAPQAETPAAQPQSGGVPAEAPATVLPEVLPEAAAPDVSDTTAPVGETAPTAPASESGLPWWQIALGLAVVLLASFAFWRFRRRPAESYEEPVVYEPVAEPVLAAGPPAKLAPKPVQAPASRPKLTVSFVPEKATLSFTSLTVKGELHLVNEGNAPARDLRLRATLLSANAGQDQMIAAFHAGAYPLPEEQLGEAKVGERIGINIEMAVPVAELQSYEVQNRRIMVPLMVADIAYEWDGGSDSAQLACLVGREAQPPAKKMAPFRLDLGPRSFAPLGQRPLHA